MPRSGTSFNNPVAQRAVRGSNELKIVPPGQFSEGSAYPALRASRLYGVNEIAIAPRCHASQYHNRYGNDWSSIIRHRSAMSRLPPQPLWQQLELPSPGERHIADRASRIRTSLSTRRIKVAAETKNRVPAADDKSRPRITGAGKHLPAERHLFQ